jgi:hypothetical protein
MKIYFRKKMSDNDSSGDEDLKGWEEDYEKELNKELECDGPISNGEKYLKLRNAYTTGTNNNSNPKSNLL